MRKIQDQEKPVAVSALSLPALHQHIAAWIGSATPSQIRQLPEILRNSSADGASEKLLQKLSRIESNLKELCGLTNEVEELENIL